MYGCYSYCYVSDVKVTVMYRMLQLLLCIDLAKDPLAKDPLGKDPLAKDQLAKDPLAKDPLSKLELNPGLLLSRRTPYHRANQAVFKTDCSQFPPSPLPVDCHYGDPPTFTAQIQVTQL